jgi:hypothetical protein
VVEVVHEGQCVIEAIGVRGEKRAMREGERFKQGERRERGEKVLASLLLPPPHAPALIRRDAARARGPGGYYMPETAPAICGAARWSSGRARSPSVALDEGQEKESCPLSRRALRCPP